jgi:TatD DNase family protein
VEVANEFEVGVYAAIGLHPVHTAKSFHDAKELGATEDDKGFTSRGEQFDPAYYKDLSRDPKVVAIGECGLDYFHLEGDIEEKKIKQKEAFEAQIALAHEVKKPLMIHCRNAFPDLINILRADKDLLLPEPGAIHFFSGTLEEAKNLLELGFSFTFGGVTTFTRDYDEVIKTLPVDRILSETDAPYVTPEPHRGKRNEPVYVTEVAKRLAALKNLDLEAMAGSILSNVRRVFPGT